MPPRFTALLACALLAGCGGTGGEKVRPHIFLITSDTLRADHLSVFGYARETSPALDSFARRSLHFTDAVTVTPKTGSSFATIFLGRHPREHGVASNFEALPPGLPVLAEQLKALGYDTAAFVGNPALRRGKGFARGFDAYQMMDGRRDEGVRSVNQAFLEWARPHDWTRPTFAWVHYMDPHGPYAPPAAFAHLFINDEAAASEERVPLAPASPPSGNPNKILGAIPAYQQRSGEDRVAAYVALYDAEIRYMDEAFGEVIAFLEEQGLYDPSAVVFTSDHGESLGEHDYWFEHGWFAYEPTRHVPLIIKTPGQTEGKVVERQVSNLDMLPTILALAGSTADGALAGADVAGPLDERAPVLIESSDRYPDKFYGVRTSRWKYLMKESDGGEELYDLREDPGELRNVAGGEPERLAELREICAESLRRARDRAVPPSSGIPDDPETLERLKSLGYLE
jgi:arylsulfatase A-like enzyme